MAVVSLVATVTQLLQVDLEEEASVPLERQVALAVLPQVTMLSAQPNPVALVPPQPPLAQEALVAVEASARLPLLAQAQALEAALEQLSVVKLQLQMELPVLLSTP